MKSERQDSVSKSEYWSSHIAGWKASSQTQRAYCEVHGLNFSVFCYWRKKLSEPSSSRPLIPVTVLSTPSRPSSSSSLSESGLSLWVGTDYRIEISESFVPETLQRLVRSLESL